MVVPQSEMCWAYESVSAHSVYCLWCHTVCVADSAWHEHLRFETVCSHYLGSSRGSISCISSCTLTS